MRSIRKRLTFANVISCLALFVALGGAAYATGKLERNSVGTRQIKNNAVTEAKIKDGSVTGAKVKSGSLTGMQINASSLGTVPSATNATAATNATSLGGSQPRSLAKLESAERSRNK